MRQPDPLIPDPLILGAGPAGCAAAIVLARGGATPLVIDRDEHPGDPLCGGFLSWRTVEQLRALGVDPASLGAHSVDHLRLFDGRHEASLPLPRPAFGLSRHALDSSLRKAAQEIGVRFSFDTIRSLSPGVAHGRMHDWSAPSLFLATGKHDVRGSSRPRDSADSALGMRLRLPPSADRTALLDGAIELHLFGGGYAGIVLQEDGSANVCLALRKSALAKAGGDPHDLLDKIASQNSALAKRLGNDWRSAQIETIGAVPYGWIAQQTEPGLFRLGDQAAVIPSLAGEGIGIALASGAMAARYWLDGASAAAPAYQREFATRAARPVRLARMVWMLAENRLGSRLAIGVARVAPGIVRAIADRTRIDHPALPCAPARPC